MYNYIHKVIYPTKSTEPKTWRRQLFQRGPCAEGGRSDFTLYTCEYMYVSLSLYIYMCIHICLLLYYSAEPSARTTPPCAGTICIYIYTYKHTYITIIIVVIILYVCICVYIYIYAYIYIYIYIYIFRHNDSGGVVRIGALGRYYCDRKIRPIYLYLSLSIYIYIYTYEY